jgi:hypothetical protein
VPPDELVSASITIANSAVEVSSDVSGESDYYIVQRSSGLASEGWEAVSVLPGTTTGVLWSAPLSETNAPSAFYRVIAE